MSILKHALIQLLPGYNLVQWGVMRSRGATLSHTESSEASRKAGQDFISEEAPGLTYMWKSEGGDQNFKSRRSRCAGS